MAKASLIFFYFLDFDFKNIRFIGFKDHRNHLDEFHSVIGTELGFELIKFIDQKGDQGRVKEFFIL
ncbi:hypothetical protein D3C85_1705840 [compost metagenome]